MPSAAPATPSTNESDTSPGDLPPPRLPALSGVRVLAIGWVIVRHLGRGPLFEHVPRLLQRAIGHAYVLMPFFFVLSGFMLTYVYGDAIRSGRLGRRSFLISRLLRIWPIYLVALAIRFVADIHFNDGVSAKYVAGTVLHALLLQAWTPTYVWYGNAPGWTVSVEVFLYLIFPWLLSRVYTWSLSRTLSVSSLAWALGQLVPLAYVLIRPDGSPPKDDPYAYYFDAVRYMPLMHVPSFFMGIATARVYAGDRAAGRRRAGGVLVFMGLIPVLFTFGGGIEFGLSKIGIATWVMPFGYAGLLSPAWALIALGLAHGGAPFSWIGAAPLARIGDASYGLYILHFPVVDALLAYVVPTWDSSSFFLLEVFVLLVLLSVLSFERFEEPLRAALLRRWSPKEARERAARVSSRKKGIAWF